MTDVKVGSFLKWEAADTTGIIGAVKPIALIWCETEAANRDIAANDALTITDQDDVVLLEKVASAINDTLVMFWPRGAGPVFNGIKVTNLDGGVLFIWTDTPIYSQA